jgi:FkbM family methyltransferase
MNALLPNGLVVHSLNKADTLMVYRDIFDDDCYRRNGVTIRDGDCILDVGANTGLFILFLNRILSRGRVFGFEPLPETFRVLERNVREHDHLDTKLFEVGLSRASGEAVFTFYPRLSNGSTMYPDDSAEGAERGRQYVLDQIPALPWFLRCLVSLTPRPLRNLIAEGIRRYYMKAEQVKCRLWTLTEFLRQYEISTIDLLKIDAEQSEQDILAGLAEEDWPKIRQLVVEVHQGEQATRDMAEALRGRGFQAVVEPNPAVVGLTLIYAIRPTKS